MPGRNIAMARHGTQFSGDGVNLSWPLNGQREVSPKPEVLSTRLLLRIANGYIVETDEEATISLPEEPSNGLLFGADARRVFDEPPKQVQIRATVRTYDPKPENDVRIKHLIEPDAGGTATAVMENIPMRPKGSKPRGALLTKTKGK